MPKYGPPTIYNGGELPDRFQPWFIIWDEENDEYRPESQVAAQRNEICTLADIIDDALLHAYRAVLEPERVVRSVWVGVSVDDDNLFVRLDGPALISSHRLSITFEDGVPVAVQIGENDDA